jgi:hypothetical protein
MSAALEDAYEAAFIDGEPVPMVFAVRLTEPDKIMVAFAKAKTEAEAWFIRNRPRILRKLKKQRRAVRRSARRRELRKAAERKAERDALKRAFARIDARRRATKCSTRKR